MVIKTVFWKPKSLFASLKLLRFSMVFLELFKIINLSSEIKFLVISLKLFNSSVLFFEKIKPEPPVKINFDDWFCFWKFIALKYLASLPDKTKIESKSKLLDLLR